MQIHTAMNRLGRVIIALVNFPHDSDMSQLKRIDQILAHLKRQQAHGGMEYQQAVNLEALIAAFRHIRAVVLRELDSSACRDLPLMSETAVDDMLRDLRD